MSSPSITELAAAARLELKPLWDARIATLKVNAAAAEAAERERLKREARIIAVANRQHGVQAAAAAAERNRLALEILQDEMAEMKRQMAAAAPPPEPEALHMRERVIQLDTLYKSSLEELATARAEIAALKGVLNALIGTVASSKGISIGTDSKRDENCLLLRNYIKAHLGSSNADSIYLG
jgi:hypothetical protein